MAAVVCLLRNAYECATEGQRKTVFSTESFRKKVNFICSCKDFIDKSLQKMPMSKIMGAINFVDCYNMLLRWKYMSYFYIMYRNQ